MQFILRLWITMLRLVLPSCSQHARPWRWLFSTRDGSVVRKKDAHLTYSNIRALFLDSADTQSMFGKGATPMARAFTSPMASKEISLDELEEILVKVEKQLPVEGVYALQALPPQSASSTYRLVSEVRPSGGIRRRIIRRLPGGEETEVEEGGLVDEMSASDARIRRYIEVEQVKQWLFCYPPQQRPCHTMALRPLHFIFCFLPLCVLLSPLCTPFPPFCDRVENRQ